MPYHIVSTDKEAKYERLHILEKMEGLEIRFDKNLNDFLDIVRGAEYPDPEKREYIQLLIENSEALKKALSDSGWCTKEAFHGEQTLGRANQVLEDLIAGKVNEKHIEQSMLLVRDLNDEKDAALLESAFMGFIAVVVLIGSLLFAIPTAGITLLCLLSAVQTGLFAKIGYDNVKNVSERKEKLESFVKTGESLFSEGKGKPKDGEDWVDLLDSPPDSSHK